MAHLWKPKKISVNARHCEEVVDQYVDADVVTDELREVTLKKVIEALDEKRMELLDIVVHLEKVMCDASNPTGRRASRQHPSPAKGADCPAAAAAAAAAAGASAVAVATAAAAVAAVAVSAAAAGAAACVTGAVMYWHVFWHV
eukprot:s2391_g5.t1